MVAGLNYDGRVFQARSNSSNGEVSAATLFHYHQCGDRLWAEYAGGQIISGHLQGVVREDGSLLFLYHHQNQQGELCAGRCESTPSFDASGRLQLDERWQWFTGDQSCGESVLIEVLTDEQEVVR